MPGSEKYWKRRKVREAYEMYDKAESFADDLAAVYQRSSRYITSNAEQIFEKYKAKYGLSETEARQLISTIRNKDDIESLLDALSRSDKEAAKEIKMLLESAAYRSRITRLMDLQSQIDDIVRTIYKMELLSTTDFYKDLAKDTYYHGIYGIQQRTGLGFGFSHVDHKQIDKVIKSKWSGKNYSRRIWHNTQALADTLKKELAVSLITGRTERETSNIIAEKFAQGAMQARRLIRTESNYVSTQMDFAAYKEAGIESYLYLATLDLKTSKICRDLDGKIFPLDEQQVGVNCPPMHPWCRSTTIAVIDKELLQKMKRRARDPKTGKTFLVPMTMSYNQWYKKYVKGGDKMKVIKRYVDKYTKEIIEPGTDLKDLTPTRQKELIKAGVIEATKEKKEKKEKE